MAEATDILLKWARSPESAKPLGEVEAKQARAALSSAQAQERVWRACLEHAQTQNAKNISFKSSENPWSPAMALMKVGLDPARMGAKSGEGPILWAVRQELWELASSAIAWAQKGEINRANDKGETAIMMAAGRLAGGAVNGSKALAAAQLITDIASAKGFDAKQKDQAAQAFFTLQTSPLHWVAAQRKQPGAEPAVALAMNEKLIKAFVAGGLDLNAARLGRGVNIGASICTPLSYLVKRLHQWDQMVGVFSDPKLKDVAEGLISQMIALGADPGLQIEKSERNALMEICQNGRLSQRVASSLEWAIMSKELGLKSANHGGRSEEGDAGSTPAAKKVSRRL